MCVCVLGWEEGGRKICEGRLYRLCVEEKGGGVCDCGVMMHVPRDLFPHIQFP